MPATKPRYLIYGLVDPRTLLVRYVGMSSSGMQRPKQHGQPSCPDTYCRRWVKSLQRRGLAYQIVVLEVLEDAIALPETEWWWIAFGRSCGWPLTNANGGGKLSTDALEKLRARRNSRLIARAEREHVRLSPEVIAERARLHKLKNPPPAPPRDSAVLRKQCFDLFEKHIGSKQLLIHVVIEARVTPDTAESFYREWLHALWQRNMVARTPIVPIRTAQDTRF